MAHDKRGHTLERVRITTQPRVCAFAGEKPQSSLWLCVKWVVQINAVVAFPTCKAGTEMLR